MKIRKHILILVAAVLFLWFGLCVFAEPSESPLASDNGVVLYANGIKTDSFPDIDSAFALITDSQTDYVILLTDENTDYTVSGDKTPDAKSIVIRNELPTDKNVTITVDTFTVSSALEFANVSVRFNKIDIGSSAIGFNRVSRAKGTELAGENSSSVVLNYSTLNISLIDVGTVTSVGFSFTEGEFYANKVKGCVSFGTPLGSDKTYKVDIEAYYMQQPSDYIRVESGAVWNGKAGKIDIVIDRVYHAAQTDFAFINILYNKEGYPKITVKDADCSVNILLMPLSGIKVAQTGSSESVDVNGTPDLTSVNAILKDINGRVTGIYKAENENSIGFIDAIGCYFRNLTSYSAITPLLPDSDITSGYQHLSDGRIFVRHACADYKTYWYTVPASASKDGQTVYKCSLCESKYTEIIPKPQTEGVVVSGSISSFGKDKTVTVIELILNGVTVKEIKCYKDFSIKNVKAGNYVLRVSKQNHVSREYTLVVADTDVVQNVEMLLAGDTDGNGVINTVDWNRIRDHITGLTKITDDYLLDVADVNRDGKVNTMDWNGIRDDITQLSPIHSEWTEEEISPDDDPGEDRITPYYIGKTNEETCYNYFTMVMNLNTAAASGILANIKAESSFRNNNLEGIYEKSLGYSDATYTAAVDSGEYKNFCTDKAGYGLFQWTSEERKTEYYNFVKERGVSISDITAQLDFFAIEIQSNSRYRLAWETLSTVWNDADGAYDAGYSVCYNFERPSDRASRSVTRGESARDTYFAKYYVSQVQ